MCSAAACLAAAQRGGAQLVGVFWIFGGYSRQRARAKDCACRSQEAGGAFCAPCFRYATALARRHPQRRPRRNRGRDLGNLLRQPALKRFLFVGLGLPSGPPIGAPPRGSRRGWQKRRQRRLRPSRCLQFRRVRRDRHDLVRRVEHAPVPLLVGVAGKGSAFERPQILGPQEVECGLGRWRQQERIKMDALASGLALTDNCDLPADGGP